MSMLARHLVYKEKIGVNHSSEVAIKIPARDGGKELADGRMWKAMAGDMLVMLVKSGGRIFALAETCSHLGGPLSEGEFDDESVKCPWPARALRWRTVALSTDPFRSRNPVLKPGSAPARSKFARADNCGACA
jgi:nitrite reductase/ring-hydroxylating ferredoxin subunit